MLRRLRHAFVSDYNVFTASSIQEGHKLLSEYDMHVAVVKNMMPEMTALQFFESISHDFPKLVHVVLSDSDDASSLQQAYETGQIFRFIQAPYSNIELEMTIQNGLKLHQKDFENQQLSDKISTYQKEQENILDLFKRYVPSEVVSKALKANKDDIMKPGESRIVSVLFADIRGFTKLSSRLAPSELVRFLNDYWDIISDSVKKNKGSVNKYMGDGMLAVFGAPISDINNHENAVSAALDIIDSLTQVNQKYAEKLGSEISVGIGINSGEVVAGNIGTDDFMEYSVIGNTVNIASRLETISKNMPNSIIISKETYNLVKDTFKTSAFHKTELINKDETIHYCEVIGYKSDNIYPMNSSSMK